MVGRLKVATESAPETTQKRPENDAKNNAGEKVLEDLSGGVKPDQARSDKSL